MKFVCDKCQQRYHVDDRKVGRRTLRIRCRQCGSVISVRDPHTVNSEADVHPARAVAGKRAPQGPASGSHRTISGSLQKIDEIAWHYSVNGKSFGPFQEDDLIAKFLSGQIGDEAYVWNMDMEGWRPAFEIPVFAPAIDEGKRRHPKLPTLNIPSMELETLRESFEAQQKAAEAADSAKAAEDAKAANLRVEADLSSDFPNETSSQRSAEEPTRRAVLGKLALKVASREAAKVQPEPEPEPDADLGWSEFASDSGNFEAQAPKASEAPEPTAALNRLKALNERLAKAPEETGETASAGLKRSTGTHRSSGRIPRPTSLGTQRPLGTQAPDLSIGTDRVERGSLGQGTADKLLGDALSLERAASAAFDSIGLFDDGSPSAKGLHTGDVEAVKAESIADALSAAEELSGFGEATADPPVEEAVLRPEPEPEEAADSTTSDTPAEADEPDGQDYDFHVYSVEVEAVAKEPGALQVGAVTEEPELAAAEAIDEEPEAPPIEAVAQEPELVETAAIEEEPELAETAAIEEEPLLTDQEPEPVEDLASEAVSEHDGPTLTPNEHSAELAAVLQEAEAVTGEDSPTVMLTPLPDLESPSDDGGAPTVMLAPLPDLESPSEDGGAPTVMLAPLPDLESPSEDGGAPTVMLTPLAEVVAKPETLPTAGFESSDGELSDEDAEELDLEDLTNFIEEVEESVEVPAIAQQPSEAVEAQPVAPEPEPVKTSAAEDQHDVDFAEWARDTGSHGKVSTLPGPPPSLTTDKKSKRAQRADRRKAALLAAANAKAEALPVTTASALIDIKKVQRSGRSKRWVIVGALGLMIAGIAIVVPIVQSNSQKEHLNEIAAETDMGADQADAEEGTGRAAIPSTDTAVFEQSAAIRDGKRLVYQALRGARSTAQLAGEALAEAQLAQLEADRQANHEAEHNSERRRTRDSEGTAEGNTTQNGSGSRFSNLDRRATVAVNHTVDEEANVRANSSDVGAEYFAEDLPRVRRAVQRCHEIQLREASGSTLERVVVDITVEPNGDVVLGIDASISNTAFARCLQTRYQTWSFRRFEGSSVTLQRTYALQ